MKINTNLQSLMVQKNLSNSTTALNTAIERMTTGYKINHSADNAANYSVANSYSSKLSSYQVAQDNISAGLDLVATAQDTISLMQSKGERLMSLWTQAQNGTYGASSIDAINTEATAIVQEINRLYKNTEYNGVKLLERDIKLPDWTEEVKANAGKFTDGCDGFMSDPYYRDGEGNRISDDAINALTHVDGLPAFTEGEIYAVSTKEDLKNLATLVNKGKSTANVTFVMGDDIDLEGEEWTAIGQSNAAKRFKGTFDGNGHKITGLKIDKSNTSNQGLFGYTETGSMVKNINIQDADVNAKSYTGCLVGYSRGNVSNCFATGSVTSGSMSGGLVGAIMGAMSNCYTETNVNGHGNDVGGLVGYLMRNGTMDNCYSGSNVNTSGGSQATGGLVGFSYGIISNCYATGDVTSSNNMGTGGLVGLSSGIIDNCYATGSVTGINRVGGLVGHLANDTGEAAVITVTEINNSFSTGDTSGSYAVGGIAGRFCGGNINKTCSSGTITGLDSIGGMFGETWLDISYGGNINISDSISYSQVSGTNHIGSFIGANIARYYSDSTSCTLTITSCQSINQNMNKLGGWYDASIDGNWVTDYDFSPYTDNIADIDDALKIKTLQVGIDGNSSNQISVDTSLGCNLNFITVNGIQNAKNEKFLNDFLSQLSNKSTALGAVTNRLESALESTTTNINNLTSSLSTIKDVDMAKVSSQYIRQQILQQASATLLSTANQSPALTLQLIGRLGN